MRPITLILVNRIPRIANGKVDRHASKKLAVLHQDHLIEESALELLSNLEGRLGNIWKKCFVNMILAQLKFPDVRTSSR
jgi:hypothetical protein